MSRPAAEHGVAAERRDRGDFGIQKQENVVLIYSCDTSSRPLNAKPFGRQAKSVVIRNRSIAHRSTCLVAWRSQTHGSCLGCCVACLVDRLIQIRGICLGY